MQGSSHHCRFKVIVACRSKFSTRISDLDTRSETTMMVLTRSSWVDPHYSRGEVDRAGNVLARRQPATLEEYVSSLDVINNWRSSHSFPLNTFQMNLRKTSSRIADDWLVAQRLKRVPSISQKLRRFDKMNLSRMQDIGGARAVLPSIEHIGFLHEAYKNSRIKHQLVGTKDYVHFPKLSGYRSLHLIYRYRSDRSKTYNGLQIEIQLRTRVQHAWATAVETVGTFLQQSLKSSEGHEDWLRFFELIGSGFALVEDTPIANNVPDERKKLVSEIKKISNKLKVKQKLEAFGNTLKIIDQHAKIHNQKYFLLSLRPDEEAQLRIWAFSGNQLELATNRYLKEEKETVNSSGEIVLVSADSLEALRKAFPNYFLDTQIFITEMDSLLS